MSATIADVAAALPTVWPRARNLTRNYHDAQDLLHTTFINAVEALHTFRTEQPIKHWLHRVMFSAYMDHWRRGGGKRGVTRYSNPYVSINVLPGFDPPALDNPEANCEIELMLRAISRLPDYQRRVVELHVQGVPGEQIARILGIADNTVRSRTCRARETLSAAHLGET